MTIPSIARALAEGKTSAETLAREALARIRASDDTIHAFLALHEDRALERAQAIDAQIAAGKSPEAIGPLAGVPVALKDNICLAHGSTSCASKYLAEFESPYSATAAERLEAAGAISTYSRVYQLSGEDLTSQLEKQEKKEANTRLRRTTPHTETHEKKEKTGRRKKTNKKETA